MGRLVLTADLTNLSMRFFCFLSHPHLQKALHGFSLAYLNGQHQRACSLGPLLSKTKLAGTQALE